LKYLHLGSDTGVLSGVIF